MKKHTEGDQYFPSLTAFLLFTFFPAGGSDLASDREALVSLRASFGDRTLLWNLSDATPCAWVGVNCTDNRVTVLRLPGMGLSVQLPLGLGNLTQLHTLSLRMNALSGPLPSDFSKLLALRYLYLQGNSFSGELPGVLFSLKNLVRVILANNYFSGEISSGFNYLSSLETLYLEKNQFTGSIPELSNPRLVKFNVSSNHLNGSIPLKLSHMPVSAFEGNSLCGKPLRSCNAENKLPAGAITGIVFGCFIGFILIVIVLIFLCRKKREWEIW